MSTTALFVEILIIGLQALVWVVLLVIASFGYDWITPIKFQLDGWEALTTIVVLAFSYTIGIIVDRMADVFFILIKPKRFLMVNKWIKKKSEQSHDDHRMKVLMKDGSALEFLQYIRSRLRIVRATFFNLIMITITCIILVLVKYNAFDLEISKLNLILIILCVSILLILPTFVALGIFETTYDVRLSQAETELIKKTQNDKV